MTKFTKYQHIEKLGAEETEGILFGKTHIFYKIDGTNSSVWFDNGKLHFGARNRELSINDDNAEFMSENINNKKLINFFNENPDVILYGEWLVPHSLNTYRKDAWRKFYVFDVVKDEKYVSYEDYKPLLESFGIDYIPLLAVGENITHEQVIKLLDKTGNFLIEDGKGLGEGLVIKNYNYKNKYGKQIWAKVVRAEFKENHSKIMGVPKIKGEYTNEQKIIDKYCTKTLVDKEYSKITNEKLVWTNKLIPMLFNRIFHCLITEEMWNILQEFGLIKIDFSLLQKLMIFAIKTIKAELFIANN